MTPGAALLDALQHVESQQTMTLAALADALGGNSAAAVIISGTSDKSSRAYKSAMRAIERNRLPQSDKNYRPGTQKATVALRGPVARRQLREHGARLVQARVEIRVSGEELARSRELENEVDELPQEALEEALDLLDAGDPEAAGALLFDSAIHAYGIGAAVHLDDVSGFRIAVNDGGEP